jgi:flagellar motility protein MotE (MotC chaperone)
MIEKLRLLPIVILAATALFGIKVDQILRGVADFGVAPALAQSKEAATSDAGEKTAAGKPKAPGRDEGDRVANADGKHDNATAEPMMAGSKKRANFTPAELEVLETLTKRREELDERSRVLQVQEQVLVAAEKRIDEKITELKALEKRFKGLLKQHDEETERQLKSLVKVYENMKAKDAARIFEQLDMDILLDVTERMREQKMAPVLAAMDPEKAKSLTVELATRRRLPETGAKSE